MDYPYLGPDMELRGLSPDCCIVEQRVIPVKRYDKKAFDEGTYTDIPSDGDHSWTGTIRPLIITLTCC